jgi:hypothetical protein
MGCSLNNDRTMELLQNIVKNKTTGNSIVNYALYGCHEDGIDICVKELSDKHIRALIYPIDNNHAALKIILEHLVLELEELSYFVGCLTRNECITKILDMQLGHQHAKRHLIFFGGVSSRLSDEDDIKKMDEWLSKDIKQQLFFCYEKEGTRIEDIDVEEISHDPLPNEPMARMKFKADKLEKNIDLYADATRNRVHLIPLKSNLNTHMIILDNQIYFNILTSHKSLNSVTLRTTNDIIGMKIKKDLIEYLLHELDKKVLVENSEDSHLLMNIISDIR